MRLASLAAKLVFAATLALIVIGSLISMDLAKTASAGVNDKIQHVVVYGFATVCALAGFRRSVLVIGGLLALGLGLEVLQGFTAFGRAFDLLDLAANTLGVAAGATAMLTARAIRQRHVAPTRASHH